MRRHLALCLLVWLLSRVLVALVLWSVSRDGGDVLDEILRITSTRWDAEHYLALASEGYPPRVPTALDEPSLRWAFFPLFPWLIRALSFGVFPVGPVAIIANFFLSIAAALLLFVWLRRRLSDEQALLGVLSFSLWPQSYFFSYAYSEPLYLTLLLALLLVVDRDVVSLSAAAFAVPLCFLAGIARPTALIVAAAFAGGVLLDALAARRRGVSVPLRARSVIAVLLVVTTAAANLAFSYGLCRVRTGEWANCHLAAEVHGWGFGGVKLPLNFFGDVVRIFRTDEVPLWYVVRSWELAAFVLCVVLAGVAARRASTWGFFPALLMLAPVASELSAWTLRSVPRFMAATPALFLVAGTLPPRVATPLLLLSVLLLVLSHAATALGVWQSF